jgi:hypothetical protein
LILLSPTLWGQTNQNIVGTVKDPSGATIPNVKVEWIQGGHCQ